MTTILLEDTKPNPRTARARSRQHSRRMQRSSEGALAQAPTAPSLAIKAQKEGGLKEGRLQETSSSCAAKFELTRIPSTLESESTGKLSSLFECDQYVDRFGNTHYIPAALPSFAAHIVPSDLISCSPQQNTTSEIPSQPSPFEAFGIKAHRTKATSNEICKNFVKNGCCFWDSRCHRIHPLDTALYFNALFRSSSLRTSEPTAQMECLQLPAFTASEPPIASSSQDCSTPRVKLPIPNKLTQIEPQTKSGSQAKVTPVSPPPAPTASRHHRVASTVSSSQNTSSAPLTSATHHTLPLKLLSTTTPDVPPLQGSSRPTVKPSNATVSDVKRATERRDAGAGRDRKPTRVSPTPSGGQRTYQTKIIFRHTPTSSSMSNDPGSSTGAPRSQSPILPHKNNVTHKIPPQDEPAISHVTFNNPRHHRSLRDRSNRSQASSASSSSTAVDAPDWDEKTGFWGYSLGIKAWVDAGNLSDDSMGSSMFSVARTSSSRSSVIEDNFIPRQDRSIERHPRPPRYPEVCGLWLNGRCTKEYQCRFVHEDLDYDELPPPPLKQERIGLPVQRNIEVGPPPMHRPAPRPPEVFFATIHDHIKVRFGEGFEVQNIITGFETPWIFIANVPTRVKESDITKLVKPFGQIVDVRLPTSKSDAPAMLVKVRMSTPLEASQARTALHGSKSFGTKISVRLGLNNSTGGAAMLRDNVVRIEWEAPGKIAYGGYSTLEGAQRAIAATRVPVGDHFVRGTIHSGLPVVGVVTVRFRTLPLDVDEAAMEKLANPEDVMWERPNYTSLPRAINGIKRILEEGAELLEFDILPPPYRDSKIRAWAHFASPADAKAARDRLSGRKPAFTGLTPVYARHVKTITYSLNLEKFSKVASDLYALRDSVGGRGPNSSTTVSIIPRQAQGYMIVKLCGEELKELGQLKAELERLLTGEVIREDGKVIWDNYFSQTAGMIFLEDLQRVHPRITIQKDVTRRMVRLFGPSDLRAVVRQEIIQKATQLRTQKVHVISLDGRLIGLFMSPDLMKLQQDLGQENVILDLWNRVLKIRGDSLAFDIAFDIVNKARQRHQGERSSQEDGCPVCFDAPSLPVTLHCGHSWCRACLEGYFNAAIDQKFFPLTCLGDQARCSERIPLETARQVLPLNGFDAVVEAAFSAHIHTHPDEFHFCPSPDCPQVYRATADAAVLQCPSCLVRICTGCHSEEHVGLACAEADGGDGLFKEWMKEHDVKNCPSCQVPIERAEGCNHMTCTRCQTHICWVCMETFPGGEGIYGHMRSEHGSFGLGPIE